MFPFSFIKTRKQIGIACTERVNEIRGYNEKRIDTLTKRIEKMGLTDLTLDEFIEKVTSDEFRNKVHLDEEAQGTLQEVSRFLQERDLIKKFEFVAEHVADNDDGNEETTLRYDDLRFIFAPYEFEENEKLERRQMGLTEALGGALDKRARY